MALSAYLLEVWAMVARGEPCWLSVRNQGGLAGAGWNDQRFFVLDGADHKSLVLGAFENFLLMKTIESLGCVLSGYAESRC